MESALRLFSGLAALLVECRQTFLAAIASAVESWHMTSSRKFYIVSSINSIIMTISIFASEPPFNAVLTVFVSAIKSETR